MKEIKGLKPFTRFLMTIGELPSSYLVSMTYEEQLLWFCNYLQNVVIPTINNNGEAVEELQNKFIELKSYVDNYFENLDVQEEINNKLDEMAESGQLAELIAQFLDMGVLLVYDTASDLAGAENINEGSACYILGKDTYNDGKGAFYKVRELLNTDTPDGDNIITLTETDNLVAEKLPNYYINEINDNITTINGNITTLTNRLNLLTNRKFIFIGDSYAQGYTPDGNITGWPTVIVNTLGLTNYTIKYYGGTGFAYTVDDKNFITLLDEVDADNTVTDIVVCGGYNDQYAIGSIPQGISNFKTLANTKFPNATIHIGEIGWTMDTSKMFAITQVVSEYNRVAKSLGLHYLNNVEYSLHDYGAVFHSDNNHPNQTGQNRIAHNIIEGILYGSCNVIGTYINIHALNLNSDIYSENLTTTLGCSINNGMVEVSSQGDWTISFSTNQSYSSRDGLLVKLFDIDTTNYHSYIIGNTYGYNVAKVPVIIAAQGGSYYNGNAQFIFKDGSVYLDVVGQINDSHNNYLSLTIAQIQGLAGIQLTCDSLMC